ncbi:uncharacterized protein B0P05DRAFT_561785 [Gilbertella persicaria]|uniref:uncharacterized protein n=1 Tax=Gilbertella persicaria TaxID=101096 RepID=UPI00221E72C6|nr:uncharacterized protein B0P05DRAFT_561785 [Gilbertella persicaria]KAI8053148.1 hypothetical protein B0P05DRAFT_561785 [Gilbertella persicaria]
MLGKKSRSEYSNTMFDSLNSCVDSLTSCNQTLDSLLSLLEPVRIETAIYKEIFDYSRNYDLATVSDIRQVRKEVDKLLTTGNGKKISESIDASIAALKEIETDLLDRVQKQELYLKNLKEGQVRKAPVRPFKQLTIEESSLLKQVDIRNQNLNKLCEAEDELIIEEHNQVLMLKRENLEVEKELEEASIQTRNTEREQEQEEDRLLKELKELDQQIKEMQQQTALSSQEPAQDSIPAHLNMLDSIITTLTINNSKASPLTIENCGRYLDAFQHEIMPLIQHTQPISNEPLPAHQLQTLLSDTASREKWLNAMKILCKQLMPNHIMGKTASQLLEILIRDPNLEVSVDRLRQEFPIEKEKRHQLTLVAQMQLESEIIALKENDIVINK